QAAFDTVGADLARSRFRSAAGEAMRVVSAANKYISDMEPWKLAKEPAQADRLATVLHTSLQVVSDANALLTPFLPPTRRCRRAARARTAPSAAGTGSAARWRPSPRSARWTTSSHPRCRR